MTNATKLREAENLLAQVILSRGDRLSSHDIAAIIEQFRPVLLDRYYQFDDSDFNQLLKSLETQYVTTMGAGVSLIDPDIPHDEEWYLKRDIRWDYAEDYQKYLINQGWPTRVVGSMNSVADRILGLLHDPHEDGDWERRGLVIGHVQSGKTANYIGLISKAADAGYKFIIVIAGIHNNLRTQTQERIDSGFIGRDSRTTNRPTGVGALRPNRAAPVTVTTAESDFNKALARRFVMELDSLNRTFILVIKKNASTLSSLYNWLKELNTREELEKITDIPMLLIDDEADHASINTNKPDLNPTKINSEIRRILNLFRKRCYVGYTATPFANVFINPDGEDEMLGSDLFPAHFIHCLDAPTNYCGAAKMFPDEDVSDNAFIREIDDAEDYIPLQHKKSFLLTDLPPSLKRAIRLFILSRAIRNLRGHSNDHCSMMINVSRFVDIQRDVKALTEIYVDKLKKAVRFNYQLPIAIANRNEYLTDLHGDFLSEYSDAGIEWTEVLKELNNAANAIRVFLINSKSDQALDYAAYEKDGSALTAIAVGGLSLSRGLTLEGLTVSYIYRNSKMYDTLMQMGRWFGYRDGYEDLCRVYMSDASYGWYCYITEATEELRMQIKRMRREGKKPSDFGLYVRAHPNTLLVTAQNKMYHAASRELRVSYDGKLMETHILPRSAEKNASNRRLLKTFYDHLRGLEEPQTDRTNSLLFRDVPWDQIQDFIFSFRFHADMFDLQENIPRFIKEVSDIYPVWDVAFRSLSGRQPEAGDLIAAQARTVGYDEAGVRRPVSESGWYTGNKNRFSGNSMFEIGLSDAQMEEARALAASAERKKPLFRDYTNARGKPLLMLHLLDLVDKGNTALATLVPALSVSFPNSEYVRTVEYVVNPVWLKQFEENQYDAPDEEDDYEFEF